MPGLTDEMDRGHRAERLLDDDLFKGAFDAVEQQLISRILDAPLSTNVDSFRQSLVLLKLVRQEIEHHMKTGKMAAIQSDGAAGEARTT